MFSKKFAYMVNGDGDMKTHSPLFPRSGTIAIIIILALSAVVAIIFAIYSFKTAALYGDNCINKLCRADLGLKCINSTCTCSLDYYFAKSCKLKKQFMQKCHNVSAPCSDTANLDCLDGVCKCKEVSYWNNNYCELKQIYNAPCFSNANIDCLTSQLLNCTNRCICSDDR